MAKNRGKAPELQEERLPAETPEKAAPERPEEPEKQEKQQGKKIDRLQLSKWTNVLNEYRSGKANLEGRVKESENWWKLRNGIDQNVGKNGRENTGRFQSRSAWLHNVIVSKHADALKAYPEPNILPREQGDQDEAKMLTSIIPCVLEQNDFESVYSQNAWRKLKTGTGVYKVVWDPRKYNGLGDIAIYNCDLLNVFWEPGVTDIQKSRFFFQTCLTDKELIEEAYPELKDELRGGSGFTASKFDTDDTVKTSGKVTVIEVYYHRKDGDRKLLHYCKYVGQTVLYASEDDPECADGFYEHGMYPFVFDTLFPIEGSPCGYGFVDICRNPQMAIDKMRDAMVRNMIAGARPRYFTRIDGAINEEEFSNLENEIIHVNGSLEERDIRVVDFKPLSGNYISALNEVISELRETSGNTETATGSVNYGVTAASAIAALQEASGKGSADSTLTSYRAYRQVVLLIIELVRQFYDAPRQFRITGDMGETAFVTYDNENLKPQDQGVDFGEDMGYRVPIFDVKVEAAKKNAFSRISQNELALQLYGAGIFNPQMAEMALAAVDMMSFEGKDSVREKIGKNAQMYKQLQEAIQAAMALCQRYEPQNLAQLAQMMGIQAPAMPMPGGGRAAEEAGTPQEERKTITEGAGDDTRTRQARERAASIGQPEA